ncbi:MAG TPA: HNH endonuclease signature motif containing protein, partial [Microcella sp.]|nr:HNH endonuclease signature motif containing protein [Microcella sp.]
PSWCEAHHINHWLRDTGRTDIADGILLCRHHHLLAHNNGWEIRRAGPSYALTPPGHPPGTPADRDMPTRSAALRDALSDPLSEALSA